MNIKESLIKALDEFNVKSKTLSDLSGLSSSQLSHFRSGRRGLELDNIEKLIDVLEPQVRVYFYSLLTGSGPEADKAHQSVSALTPYRLGKTLNANRELLLKAISYLERDVRADIMSRVIELYRSESVPDKEPAACR